MGTQIFLTICLGGLGFMVHCLIHFIREGSAPRSHSNARPVAQNQRIIHFPKHRSVRGQSEEVRRRA